jgi:aminoglycoside phosphotransferase (APT) family kinase protein
MVSTHDVTVSDSVVVKRFRSPRPGEPEREWRTLQILAEHAPGFAPEPISFSAEPPTITMSRLPGRELGGSLSAPELSALRVAIERLHSVPANAIPAEWADDPAVYVDHGRSAFPATVDNVDDVVAAAFRAGHSWFSSRDPVELISGEAPPVLARLDYNLANFLYDGNSVRMLDFENACMADRGIDLALTTEHISGRGTPDSAWQTLVESFDLLPVERRHFAAVKRVEALMWLRLLLPGGGAEKRNPPGTLRKQAERVLALL